MISHTGTESLVVINWALETVLLIQNPILLNPRVLLLLCSPDLE